jgi:nucleoside-diphosphate-sugar epimerase
MATNNPMEHSRDLLDAPFASVLVAGGRGVVGRAVVEHAVAMGATVDAISRGKPDFATTANFHSVDLSDPTSVQSLSGLAPEHLVYAAVSELPDLRAGWLDPAQIAKNGAMLRLLFDAIDTSALRHVTILQGTKAYGGHITGNMRVPAREDEPRVVHENFYWLHEDFIREQQRGKGWHFTIMRPQFVLGDVIGSNMSLVAALGVYATLAKASGGPLDFPGHPDNITECVDARLLARCIDWTARSPACHNETYNVTNGDVISWLDFWPTLAAQWDMQPGRTAPVRLASSMAASAQRWRDIARHHRLREPDMDRLIGASWHLASFAWANPATPGKPSLISTIKIRQAGWHDCLATEQNIIDLLQRMRDQNYLPAR